jgi:hypothetical protein
LAEKFNELPRVGEEEKRNVLRQVKKLDNKWGRMKHLISSSIKWDRGILET